MALIRHQPQGLARRSPFQQLHRLRQELDRIFESPLEAAAFGGMMEGWAPPLDFCETKDSVIVKAELPGLRREDINVSIHENILTISGERKEEEEFKEGDWRNRERYYGRFERSVTLPGTVEAEKISASYKDGVLTVAIPKKEGAKPKQIEIKSS